YAERRVFSPSPNFFPKRPRDRRREKSKNGGVAERPPPDLRGYSVHDGNAPQESQQPPSLLFHFGPFCALSLHRRPMLQSQDHRDRSKISRRCDKIRFLV